MGVEEPEPEYHGAIRGSPISSDRRLQGEKLESRERESEREMERGDGGVRVGRRRSA